MTVSKRPREGIADTERTTSAEKRLKKDLLRIACWIEARHPECPVCIELQRCDGCNLNEIAQVVPLVQDQKLRRVIRDEAEAAFRLLGWVIRPDIQTVHSLFGEAQSQPEHSRLRYCSEIDNLLQDIESTLSLMRLRDL